MAVKVNSDNFHAYLTYGQVMDIHDVQSRLPEAVPERTLRRWLVKAVADGKLIRTGQKRGTRYTLPGKRSPAFLDKFDESKRTSVLKQLRDLWTHTSTALEGNTLSLGDTHFILEQGLTVSGKPLREHQEITGHARAIELIYESLLSDITEALVFKIHRAIQTELVSDIYHPVGAWKREVNGTYTVDVQDNPIYLEYALPSDVPGLMTQLISYMNQIPFEQLSLEVAIREYAKIHAAIAHIHPFSDGNGRIARLLANLPLLRAGLPPIVISKELRREYIQTLAAYEVASGQLTADSGLWPVEQALEPFIDFCRNAYEETRRILTRL